MTDVSSITESTAAPTDQPASLEKQVGLESQSTAERSGEWAAFVAAVQFLTRLHLSARSVSAAALARCPVYFPLVGTLIGVFSAITLGMTCLFWPVWLSVILVLALEARLTGAFHEDAVADFCDAFGGGWTREDVLRILKDSRIGTFGALGLGLAVALRAGATIEIMHQYGPENWLVWSTAIVASSAIGRLAIVVVMLCVPPIGSRESLSRDIGIQLSRWDLLKACLWTLPAAMPFAVLLPIRALLSVVVVALITIWFMRLVRHRLGGITGDCLGCIGYCSHVVVLLVTAARWQL